MRVVIISVHESESVFHVERNRIQIRIDSQKPATGLICVLLRRAHVLPELGLGRRPHQGDPLWILHFELRLLFRIFYPQRCRRCRQEHQGNRRSRHDKHIDWRVHAIQIVACLMHKVCTNVFNKTHEQQELYG